MKQLSGHGISGGVAAGKLVTLLSAQTGVPRETSRTPDEELQRFAQALREGLLELDALQETGRTRASAEAAQIFANHKMDAAGRGFLHSCPRKAQSRGNKL